MHRPCASSTSIARQIAGLDRSGPRRPARRAEISASRRCSSSCGAPGCAADEPRFFAPVELTLARICEGGIYDHLGGGFSRYSVDERWLVPHFEKMLYDNAQLLELLALAYQRTAKTLFRTARARDRRLARARDDDAGGRVLRLARRRLGRRGGQVLRLVARRDRAQSSAPDDAAFFAAALRRHRRRAISKATISSIVSSTYRAAWRTRRRLAPMRAKLLAARAKRVRPGLDDKVLADWNGLMIAALVNAGMRVRRAVVARAGRARLRFHRRQDDARRPARPFLARRAAAVSRPRLRLSPP